MPLTSQTEDALLLLPDSLLATLSVQEAALLATFYRPARLRDSVGTSHNLAALLLKQATGKALLAFEARAQAAKVGASGGGADTAPSTSVQSCSYKIDNVTISDVL